MPLGWPAFVLAIDFGGLLAVVFVIFTILSWISNAVGTRQNPPRPAGGQQRPRPPRPAQQRPGQQRQRPVQANVPRRPRQEKLESEIEAFLQDVVGGKRQDRASIEEIEVIEEEPVRQRQYSPPLPDQGSRSERAAERRRAANERSQEFEPQLAEPVTGPLSAHHLTDTVGASVEENFAGSLQEAITEQPQYLTTSSLIEMLRSPQGIRQAILMSEILGRPKALRPQPPVDLPPKK